MSGGVASSNFSQIIPGTFVSDHEEPRKPLMTGCKMDKLVMIEIFQNLNFKLLLVIRRALLIAQDLSQTREVFHGLAIQTLTTAINDTKSIVSSQMIRGVSGHSI